MESLSTTPASNKDTATSVSHFGLLDVAIPDMRNSLFNRSVLTSEFQRRRDKLETEARAENQMRATLRRGVGVGLTGREETLQRRQERWRGVERVVPTMLRTMRTKLGKTGLR